MALEERLGNEPSQSDHVTPNDKSTSRDSSSRDVLNREILNRDLPNRELRNRESVNSEPGSRESASCESTSREPVINQKDGSDQIKLTVNNGADCWNNDDLTSSSHKRRNNTSFVSGSHKILTKRSKLN